MSQITTHILDTSIGKPAQNVPVFLFHSDGQNWNLISTGETNRDGRIPNLVNTETILESGIYKLKFDTKNYFDKSTIQTFYPYVEIIFEINSDAHYHVPLLLNPFGYSTYRGS